MQSPGADLDRLHGARIGQPALHLSLGSGPALWTSSAGRPALSPFRVGPTVHQSRKAWGRLWLCRMVWVANPGHFLTPVGIQEGYFDQFFFFF